eukprot:TRINITY_DN8870_c0_g1_i1.p1 TRINITY_DN8870_c0_g1~~TRINITY_DN8870_c0_g1_i1.p1  ORF type:complete len:351 (+),score=32.25 TRINITY_DN8870_c0_g1_i1:44-1096(+)
MGFPDELFSNTNVSQKLKCSICLSVIEDAVFHLPCQNGFCKECLSLVGKCPICRGTLTSNNVIRDITRNELIEELSACCPDCDWNGILAALPSHLATCTGPLLSCSGVGCDIHLCAQELVSHELSCDFVLITCEACGIALHRRDMENHRLSCSSEQLRRICPFMQRFRDLQQEVGRLRRLADGGSFPTIDGGELADSTAVPSPSRDGDVVEAERGEVGQLVWKIENFSNLECRYLKSPTFTDAHGSKWYCRLYPRGDGEGNEDFITFGAYRDSNSSAKYRVLIPNFKDSSLTVHRSITFASRRWDTAGWGWRKLVERCHLLSEGFLRCGQLTVVVQTELEETNLVTGRRL